MFLYSIFIFVFGLNLILSLNFVQTMILTQNAETMLFKRQVSSQDLSQSRKRARRPASEIQHEKALKAAKMLLKNDNMNLDQVMKRVKLKHMPEGQSSSTISQHASEPSSPTTKRMDELKELINAPSSPKRSQSSSHSGLTHHSNLVSSPIQRVNVLHQPSSVSTAHDPIVSGQRSPKSKSTAIEYIPELFSKDVKRKKWEKRPKGYESNANSIALSAETLLRRKQVATQEDAIKLAKEKLAKRREKQATHLRNWISIAATDPEKAREMKTNVPKNMVANLYIPARAHQLHHRGKAKDMNEAERLAKVEAEQTQEKKRKSSYAYIVRKRKPEKIKHATK